MRILISAFIVLGIAGCLEKKAPVTLKVEVKNSQGQVVPHAIIKINDIKVGESDDMGLASIETTVDINQYHRVEVIKDSRSFYYAPYFDSFKVDNEDPVVLPIRATMYFVPKPEISSESVGQAKESQGITYPENIEPLEKTENESQNSESQSVLTEIGGSIPDQDRITENVKPEERTVPILSNASKSTEVETVSQAAMPLELTIFTIHVYSANRPVADAAIHVGDQAKGNLKEGCTTNARGRCVLRIPGTDIGLRSLVISKPGYVTETTELEIVQGGKHRLDLKPGTSVDIFAMENRYQYKSGIKGAEVFVKGQPVGRTDAFGHLTHTFAGKKEDLVDVVIKAPGFLPAEFEADFVLSKPISIVRYFSPEKPRTVRMALMKAQPAGLLSKEDVINLDKHVDNLLGAAVDKYVFQVPAFNLVPRKRFEELASSSNQSLSDLLRKGWQTTEVKGEVDALIVPTIVAGESKTLELSIVDSRGRIVTAAKETLDHLADASAIDQAVLNISKSIRRLFPFEGAISSKNGDKVELNFGTDSGILLKTGDRLHVMGSQLDEFGSSQNVAKIAAIELVEVGTSSATAMVVEIEPRAALRVGDAVVFQGSNEHSHEKLSAISIRVVTTESGQTVPINQANLYLNDQWLGSTDETGRFYIDRERSNHQGILRIVRRGFSDFSRELALENKKSIDIKLEKLQTLLNVESDPSGAEVYVEEKFMGKTPLMMPMSVPSGFVKLEVKGPESYKVFKKILDLSQGNVEFTGGKRIVLEPDHQKVIASLRDSGRFTEAVDKLQSVPKEHSDYLNFQHQIGEIYLTNLGEPALAAGAFANVTSDPLVKKFIDKRFIGSHINEGIALFETAERLRSQDQGLAAAHYLKAVKVLGEVQPQLRFVPEDQYNRAVTSVGYHQALALHKLWYHTKEPEYLNQALKSWRSYLESVPSEDKTAMQDNARVYLKQAEADLQNIGQLR